MKEILKIENLKTHFKLQDGLVKAVDGISFSVTEGEVLGLVGESGSGKSMTCRSILRLVPEPGKIVDGKILYNGEDILKWPENQLVQYRGKQVSMILQEPMTALNPVWTIGDQIIETIVQHENVSQSEARDRSIELLRMVGIPVAQRRMNEYPHQFSGGMRQRAMIAIALTCRPKVLLADEPTTALDVTIQDQIIRLVQDLQQETGMSVVWVTHDLGVVAQICDRVAVMYAGKIMEMADVIELFENSRHPYTLGLMESIPTGELKGKKLVPIQGNPPDLLNLPAGCPFAPRCRFMIEACKTADIPLRPVNPGHYSACIRFREIWN
ncbi:MAG: ABC transporter ATP-binding protein [Anaerolineaceae bacterium]|nr:ABC transporter ATP-binding protein [Anaerolineaceae bacterium]